MNIIDKNSFAVINVTEVFNTDDLIMADCHSISFKNIGAVDCTIANFPLAAGDAMLTLENNNIHAVDISRYDLIFEKGKPGTKRLIVFRTFHDFSKQPQQNL